MYPNLKRHKQLYFPPTVISFALRSDLGKDFAIAAQCELNFPRTTKKSRNRDIQHQPTFNSDTRNTATHEIQLGVINTNQYQLIHHSLSGSL